MTGIAQTIPSYAGGISEQPDQLKLPGQVRDVQNAIPDLVWGLYKRPGSKRIINPDQASGALTNVQSGGSWFHYYRDASEGSYIGQIAADGRVRMWSCKTGDEKNVWYHTDNSAYSGGNSDHTSITNYLTPSTVNGVSQTEDIQALTINDTTYLNNRSKVITTTGTTDTASDTHYAFIELQRTENGRQYAFNIYDTETTTTIKTATRVEVVSDNLNERAGTGHCAAIGTQVFAVTAGSDQYYAEKGTQYTISTGSVDTSNNEIDINAHTVKSGDSIYYETNGGTAIGGLSNNTVYYAFCGDHRSLTNSIQLGSSYDDVMQRGIAKESESVISLSGTGNSSQTVSVLSTVNIKNSGGSTITTGKNNLVFRITLLGQQGGAPNRGYTNSDHNFACTYRRQVELLHGGEGWETGDVIEVNFNNGQGPVSIKVRVVKHEEVAVKTGSFGLAGAVRPDPTPFDADTAVSADSIIGGIIDNLPSGVTGTVIGPGIYLTRSSAFQVETVDNDLARVIASDTNNVQNLPNQCKDGYLVKIANARMSDEDDYYLKFNGENSKDGPGSWAECPAPGIVKSLNTATMPHVLQRQSDGDFLVKAGSYEDRLVGDATTNPLPTFADGTSKINKVLFFRNRLVFLSGSNVILSKAGKLEVPDFFAETALTVSAIDPIDITASSIFPSDLYDGIELPAGLVVFSDNQQFLLSSDDTVLDPDTAKLRSVATYNYNRVLPPISLGTTLAYLDNSGKYSRLNQMAGVAREQEPTVAEASITVPSLLPKDIDLLTNSRENQLILISKTDTDIVYGLKYFEIGNERKQAAWFKWKLNNPIKYHFIVDDNYFFLDTDDFLQTLQLVQESEDASLTQDDENYLIHLDNWTTIYGGVYNSSTKVTTFTDGTNSCEFTWQSSVTSPNGDLVLIDTNSDSTRVGRYAKPTVTSAGSTFTVPGNWSEQVRSVTITNGGSGYTSAPTVTIANPSSGITATATATISGGAVTDITITDGGSNYNSTPSVTFTGGGGSSAAGTAVISPINSTPLHIGYLYDYQVDIPRIYVTKPEGQGRKADVNSSLIVHRLKLNFGKIGLYETTLTREGKADYTEIYESSILNEYNVSDAPYLEEKIKTIPVYEKNENVDIRIKSAHPAPATLHSITWEGDYTPKYYRRG